MVKKLNKFKVRFDYLEAKSLNDDLIIQKADKTIADSKALIESNKVENALLKEKLLNKDETIKMRDESIDKLKRSLKWGGAKQGILGGLLIASLTYIIVTN
jgi:hypothetical protein